MNHAGVIPDVFKITRTDRHWNPFLKLMPTAVSAKPPYSSTIIAWEKYYYLERATVELTNNSIKNALEYPRALS